MRTPMGIRQFRVLLVAICAVLSVVTTAAARGPARNVILFVGDGMGVATVTAARILDGQNRGQPGEENFLAFERFPHVALVKTYNVDAWVPDSAGTMTALVTGSKTRRRMVSVGPEGWGNVTSSTSTGRSTWRLVGVGPEALGGDCRGAAQYHLTTLLEELEQRNLRTGVVTTTRLTDATPAATYAHVPDRGWESDANVPEADRATCPDIARQFVEFPYGDGVDVALGGGRMNFLPATAADPGNSEKTGRRLDGRDLIGAWLAARADRSFVHDRAGLNALTGSGQVLGLFSRSHMEHEADRNGDAGSEPSLTEMTRFAIDRLRNGPGFFLMVEGGRIDHAYHGGDAYRALTDVIAFARAVGAAVAMTDAAQTLILVTADHGFSMTFSSYQPHGPGAERPAEELEPTPPPPGHRQRATSPLDRLEIHIGGGHSSEDVAAYALGPGAEGIRGVMDQHELHGVMRSALFGEDG